jgi:hypothetical protein
MEFHANQGHCYANQVMTEFHANQGHCYANQVVTEFHANQGHLCEKNWTDIHGNPSTSLYVQLRKGRKKVYSEETDKDRTTDKNSADKGTQWGRQVVLKPTPHPRQAPPPFSFCPSCAQDAGQRSVLQQSCATMVVRSAQKNTDDIQRI